MRINLNPSHISSRDNSPLTPKKSEGTPIQERTGSGVNRTFASGNAVSLQKLSVAAEKLSNKENLSTPAKRGVIQILDKIARAVRSVSLFTWKEKGVVSEPSSKEKWTAAQAAVNFIKDKEEMLISGKLDYLTSLWFESSVWRNHPLTQAEITDVWTTLKPETRKYFIEGDFKDHLARLILEGKIKDTTPQGIEEILVKLR